MELLHLAHRGEAQELIKHLKMSAVENFGHIYQNEHFYLIISGEGPDETLTQLAWCVGKLPITKIINLGIAGSLNENYQAGEIYPVRTCYAYRENAPVFQSFTSISKSTIDCITTYARVLDDDFAQKLKPFAAIVDREVWACGKVAKTFKLPFESFKLISDMAGSSTECFDLKKRAQEFSHKLAEYFVLNYRRLENEGKQKSQINFPFHVSFTQQKQILKLKEKINDSVYFEKLLAKPHIKDAHIFINELENFLNPILASVKARIDILNQPLEAIGAQVLYDKNFEQKKLKLQMEINSQTNIDKLNSTLKDFKFSDYEKLWNGEIDV